MSGEPAPKGMKASKESLVAAQQRVFALQREGKAPSSKEARRAMNRLMALIRQATPQDLASFEEWRAEQRPDP